VVREDTSSGSLTIYQDVHFQDPDGDAHYMDWELISATADGVAVSDGTIEASSEEQMAGAITTGVWRCEQGENYSATISGTILDRAGNQSNTVEYTLECR
jgi:hypothetical protein